MIDRGDIVAGLRAAGLCPGMVAFSHANIAFFGPVENATSMPALIQVMLDCFVEVLGPSGTLVLPVFTYSFGSDKTEKVFDLQRTLSTTSAMGNWLIQSGQGFRSADPMLSVIAIGSKAEAITSDVDPICFGPDSVWARLHAEDALICNLNVNSGSTSLHWIEREVGVSYRSDIPMSGVIIDSGHARNATVFFTGRDYADPLARPRTDYYHKACVKNGITTVVPLGRGQIVAQRLRAAKSFLEHSLVDHPYLLTVRHAE